MLTLLSVAAAAYLGGVLTVYRIEVERYVEDPDAIAYPREGPWWTWVATGPYRTGAGEWFWCVLDERYLVTFGPRFGRER